MDWTNNSKNLISLLGLALLIFILLFLLVNFGFVRACDIPGFSSVYYGIKGKPQVAIVYGTDGYGNPEKLENILAERNNIVPILVDSRDLSYGILENYQLVIVDNAKTMKTSDLLVLSDYVKGGGRLVLTGDFATRLGPDDYICEDIGFQYLASVEYYDTYLNESSMTCGDWSSLKYPDYPIKVDGGICGRNYEELILNYIQVNKTEYDTVFKVLEPCNVSASHNVHWKVTGNERIESCLTMIRKQKAEITSENIRKICYDEGEMGVNYWKRGPTYVDSGDTTVGYDFSSFIGFRYLRDLGEVNLEMRPTESNPLTKGYTGTSNFGIVNYSLVTTEGIAKMSTKKIMSYELPSYNNEETASAVITSNPLGIAGSLVVYYSFPLEELVTFNKDTKQYEGAINLIDNLIDYMIC